MREVEEMVTHQFPSKHGALDRGIGNSDDGHPFGRRVCTGHVAALARRGPFVGRFGWRGTAYR
jgi:hypothetical protein